MTIYKRKKNLLIFLKNLKEKGIHSYYEDQEDIYQILCPKDKCFDSRAGSKRSDSVNAYNERGVVITYVYYI